MPPEALKYLFGITEHIARLQRFVHGKTFGDYDVGAVGHSAHYGFA